MCGANMEVRVWRSKVDVWKIVVVFVIESWAFPSTLWSPRVDQAWRQAPLPPEPALWHQHFSLHFDLLYKLDPAVGLKHLFPFAFFVKF